MVFTADDFIHLFRRFLATSCEPHFYNGIEATFKKLDMVFDMLIVKVMLGLIAVIEMDLRLGIISKFEIGAVEQLIIIDMTEQF